MKLKCIETRYDDWGLFTKGKEYPILKVSPNKMMVEVLSDEKVLTQVVWGTSVYGEFEIVGGEL